MIIYLCIRCITSRFYFHPCQTECIDRINTHDTWLWLSLSISAKTYWERHTTIRWIHLSTQYLLRGFWTRVHLLINLLVHPSIKLGSCLTQGITGKRVSYEGFNYFNFFFASLHFPHVVHFNTAIDHCSGYL